MTIRQETASGSPRAVYFDMDHTLLSVDSEVTWIDFLIRRGMATAADRETADAFYRDYCRGCMDDTAFLAFELHWFTGRTFAEMRDLAVLHFEEYLKPCIYPAGAALLRQYSAAGIPCGIITSTNPVIAGPVAEALGNAELHGTELETDAAGRYTGRITGPYLAQKGKVLAAERILARLDMDFSGMAYYGDSINDLNILERVGFPHAVNPSPGLLAEARKRGWPVEHWSPEK